MPIYEYCCKKCGHDFEELVFGDQTPQCPKCGSADTEKLMSCPTRCSSSDQAGGASSGYGGGGCAGCSGGSCATCH
ncbi:MAG: zinc ribbon domain-containing protein [Deltaproteobacteria bacterium]|nr:zinc ribbon domain-containing protein [Deltaproteobacteria bacterium]